MIGKLWSDMSDLSIGLSNTFIDRFLKKECENYLGIFAPDTLPSQLMKNGTLVCNLSNSNQMGSHFITIVIQERQVLYIDSFGVPCENADIKRFLDFQKKPIKHNETMIQDLASDFCGFFCILFCMYYDVSRNEPLLFFSDLSKNDNHCIRLILLLKRNKQTT